MAKSFRDVLGDLVRNVEWVGMPRAHALLRVLKFGRPFLVWISFVLNPSKLALFQLHTFHAQLPPLHLR
jgi:hypothetical protein